MTIDHGLIEALGAHRFDTLAGRSLSTTTAWERADLDAVRALARAFATLDRGGASTALCPDELAWALFFDQSTRTRSAWAGAAARLGMAPVIVDGSATQVSHGETTVETGAMVGMNAHAIGVRHDLVLGAGNRFIADITAGIDGYLAATDQDRAVPVVNLQCDVDHPTQTLADHLWLEDNLGSIAGRRITVSWASSPSYAKPLSVPQGLVTLLTRYGAHVTLAHPPGYQLLDEATSAAATQAAAASGTFRIIDDMDEAFRDAEVVYPKSWGAFDLMTERADAHGSGDAGAVADIERRALARNAEFDDWICDERRMASTAGGEAMYLHCLPADIGAEVSAGVLDAHRTALARQAQWKVYVIMALIAAAKVPDLAAELDRRARARRT